MAEAEALNSEESSKVKTGMLGCSDWAVKEEKLGCLDPSIYWSIKDYLNVQMFGVNGSIKSYSDARIMMRFKHQGIVHSIFEHQLPIPGYFQIIRNIFGLRC